MKKSNKFTEKELKSVEKIEKTIEWKDIIKKLRFKIKKVKSKKLMKKRSKINKTKMNKG